MGKILIPGSGGGTDLDVITAGAGDVLAPKVIVDRDGEPMAGTLALDGNASPADVRSGRTYYGTDAKTRMTGTMSEKGAAAYTPGSYNQVIGAGQYLAGEQTILGDGNLASQYIKKGVTIFGVTGNFEGWVPTPTDLYLRGNNIAGFTSADGYTKFESGAMHRVFMYGTTVLNAMKIFNFTSYSRLNVEYVLEKSDFQTQGDITFSLRNGWDIIGETGIHAPPYGTVITQSISLTPQSFSPKIFLEYKYGTNVTSWSAWIYRIWME